MASKPAPAVVPPVNTSTDTDDLFGDESTDTATVNPASTPVIPSPSSGAIPMSTTAAPAPVAAPTAAPARPGRKAASPADVSAFDTGNGNAGILAFSAGADPLYCTWLAIDIGNAVPDGYKRIGTTGICYSVGVTRSLSYVQETLLNADPTAMSEEAMEALAAAEEARQIAAIKQASAARLAEQRAKRTAMLTGK